VITRNINIFVSKYAYNLNNNIFLERGNKTEAKNLNSIHISHVANSIKTHGTGIMNTTVNFVYRFLGKRFYVFSQFIFDDHIKSRLIKDVRYFKENCTKLSNLYPIQRANNFGKYIQKLGLNKNGLTYIAEFKNLITEIGNALGYVRMVRSGGLRYISDAIKFLPDLDNISNFEQMISLDKLSEETKVSGKNLYSILTNLSKKFAEGSDYFKVLENVFTNEMKKEKHSHLKFFPYIIPPLTVNYVESMIVAKDKMMRSGKDANFTDDGNYKFLFRICFGVGVYFKNIKSKSTI
jgi:WASH complex subunit 7